MLWYFDLNEKDEEMGGITPLIAFGITHSTVIGMLKAIEIVGLEKVLDDLRRVTDYSNLDMTQFTEDTYGGLIQALERITLFSKFRGNMGE